jgi:hypothetical protein
MTRTIKVLVLHPKADVKAVAHGIGAEVITLEKARLAEIITLETGPPDDNGIVHPTGTMQWVDAWKVIK